MSLSLWWLFLCATAAIAATPGPNMLHIMGVSMRHGFARSIFAMAGCLSAVLLYVAASALGLGAILKASRLLFEGLRWAGVAYLLWLGWSAWRSPPQPPRAPDALAARVGGRLLYRRALWVALANPKLIVFATAFFPQFIRAGRPWLPQFAILIATFAVVEIACYCLYAGGGRRLAPPGRQRLFNRVTGSLFVLFGLGLAAARA